MTKIGVFKAKKNATKFFGSEMTPPPLSEIFRKFIAFGKYRLPLGQQFATKSVMTIMKITKTIIFMMVKMIKKFTAVLNNNST